MKLKEKTKECEASEILRVLYENGGNVAKTALALGLSRGALYAKMKEYHIDLERIR